MATTKLHYTGQTGAPLTFEKKYTVETDSTIEVDDQDVDSLLATGLFEKAGGGSSSKSSDSDNSSSSDDDSKKSSSKNS